MSEAREELKQIYRNKRNEVYATPVSYTIEYNGDTAKIETTYAMSNLIKNALHDAYSYLQDKDLESLGNRYMKLLKQMWEQDDTNGSSDCWDRIVSLNEMEDLENEALAE